MEFLKQNPLIIVAFILVILAFLARVISKPSQKKKVEKKDKDKIEVIVPSIDEQSDAVIEPLIDEPKKKEKKKLKRLKAEITRVFEKKELKPTDDSKNKILEEKSQKEEEILKSMQFVKSSKNVERLKPLTMAEIEEREKKILEQDDVLNDFQQEAVVTDQLVEEKKKTVYFDKSRRLSKMIKNDSFDDMFCSHISEKYMNMNDLEKHLRNCDEIQSKLFNRVAETIVNSEIRFTNNEDGISGSVGRKNNTTAEIERKRRETVASFLSETKDSSIEQDYDIDEILKDKIDLSARNLLVVDAVLQRKSNKNN